MQNIKIMTGSFLAGLVMLGVLAPSAFAGTQIDVQGNGAGSRSQVSVRSDDQSNIRQQNTADIRNDVRANSSTGNNTSSFNSDGSPLINTGDAGSNTAVSNNVNHNMIGDMKMGPDRNGANGNTGGKVDGRGRTRTNTIGFTDGWLDGKTVQFFYSKFSFFCKEPPTSGADSNCEAGEEAQSKPKGGDIPVIYVMTPLGFRPNDATLQCPEVGNCINHPNTIDVSRVLGAGTENLALPAHSHIIEEDKNGWWEIEVIGVKDPAVWDQIVAGKDLKTVRALQADPQNADKITGDIATNSFLFFDVIDKRNK